MEALCNIVMMVIGSVAYGYHTVSSMDLELDLDHLDLEV